MIKLAGIVEDSIVDGPGLRLVFFCQGCPHHCPGCHNEDTWPFEGGTPMEEAALFEIAKRSPLVRGVTFSGGEPFAQAEGFAKLAELLRGAGYEVASYSGYTFEELLAGTPAQRRLLAALDVLIDGRYLEAERSLSLVYRGSANQRILDVQKSLAARRAVEHGSPRWRGEYETGPRSR